MGSHLRSLTVILLSVVALAVVIFLTATYKPQANTVTYVSPFPTTSPGAIASAYQLCISTGPTSLGNPNDPGALQRYNDLVARCNQTYTRLYQLTSAQLAEIIALARDHAVPPYGVNTLEEAYKNCVGSSADPKVIEVCRQRFPTSGSNPAPVVTSTTTPNTSFITPSPVVTSPGYVDANLGGVPSGSGGTKPSTTSPKPVVTTSPSTSVVVTSPVSPSLPGTYPVETEGGTASTGQSGTKVTGTSPDSSTVTNSPKVTTGPDTLPVNGQGTVVTGQRDSQITGTRITQLKLGQGPTSGKTVESFTTDYLGTATDTPQVVIADNTAYSTGVVPVPEVALPPSLPTQEAIAKINEVFVYKRPEGKNSPYFNYFAYVKSKSDYEEAMTNAKKTQEYWNLLILAKTNPSAETLTKIDAWKDEYDNSKKGTVNKTLQKVKRFGQKFFEGKEDKIRKGARYANFLAPGLGGAANITANLLDDQKWAAERTKNMMDGAGKYKEQMDKQVKFFMSQCMEGYTVDMFEYSERFATCADYAKQVTGYVVDAASMDSLHVESNRPKESNPLERYFINPILRLAPRGK